MQANGLPIGRTPYLTVRMLFCSYRKISKRPCIVVEASNSKHPCIVEEHRALIMSQSVIFEGQIILADFTDLRFENWTLPKVIAIQGWVSFLQRTGIVSIDLVQEFYADILLVPNISDPGFEITVCNTWVLFSQDELTRFMGYERPMDTFPSIELFEEDRTPKATVSQTILGPNTVVLEGSSMSRGQLLPFWRIVHLISLTALTRRSTLQMFRFIEPS